MKNLSHNIQDIENWETCTQIDEALPVAHLKQQESNSGSIWLAFHWKEQTCFVKAALTPCSDVQLLRWRQMLSSEQAIIWISPHNALGFFAWCLPCLLPRKALLHNSVCTSDSGIPGFYAGQGPCHRMLPPAWWHHCQLPFCSREGSHWGILQIRECLFLRGCITVAPTLESWIGFHHHWDGRSHCSKDVMLLFEWCT